MTFKQAYSASNYIGMDAMKLRDYFAGLALQSILNAGISSAQYEEDAEQAYVIADAMIKARNVKT
jgi:hypothetical protein